MKLNVNGRMVDADFATLNGTELALQFKAPDTGRRYALELELAELAGPADPNAPADVIGEGGAEADPAALEAAAVAEAEAAARRAEADPNAAAAQQRREPDSAS